jgi:asparagine N-glycosylation enzyme membrane subunit Stt3
MTDDQVVLLASAFLILVAITLAAQFRWLGKGKAKTVLVFIAGVASVVALRLAGLPPSWFSGSAAGFGVALSLGLGAFVFRTAEEKAFGPSLLVANVAELISRHL